MLEICVSHVLTDKGESHFTIAQDELTKAMRRQSASHTEQYPCPRVLCVHRLFGDPARGGECGRPGAGCTTAEKSCVCVVVVLSWIICDAACPGRNPAEGGIKKKTPGKWSTNDKRRRRRIEDSETGQSVCVIVDCFLFGGVCTSQNGRVIEMIQVRRALISF